MWIIYVSITLLVVGIIYLVVSLIITLKKVRPIINIMNDRVAKMQSNIDMVATQTKIMQANQAKIQDDINYKSEIIKNSLENVKNTPRLFKSMFLNLIGNK
ncbi:uncharacterized protein YoxC [Bacillus pakistanensis]|uniref:Uncharacterized protein YoxC n=1 Tax=Rossellomorea pakistanensis TaxID=992288 RepID=A0ABS2N878_9BACI|nr:DUF948 domain-containing protein [Bacillus pakistanensis]MBM7584039.1 uncharacterized protein YoxC [Bacillus pakistanensis]